MLATGEDDWEAPAAGNVGDANGVATIVLPEQPASNPEKTSESGIPSRRRDPVTIGSWWDRRRDPATGRAYIAFW
jgi:hypothetical protein